MKKIEICVMVILSFILLSGCKDSNEVILDSHPDTFSPTQGPKPTNSVICVYVCGYVNSPGIFYLSEGSRINDAIIAAGGVSDGGSVDSLNLADYLNDCDRIYVPDINESNKTAVDGGKKNNTVNINTASTEELMTLQGIGESKAKDIIDYRSNNGSFNKIEDIMNITGIKEGLFNKIKDHISVS